MTVTPNPNTEPTLSDAIEQITSQIKDLSDKVDRSDERFTDYRQATQWVVQLAFTLIASATITVIITSIFQ